MIEAELLRKSFGSLCVVDDVSFTVAEGEFVALLGPSGGGKSTVLRMISGLDTPDSGTVKIKSRDVTGSRVQDRAVGFVFQHYALFRHMNVRDNVAFGLEVRGVSRSEARREALELLALVQLEGLGERFPNQLSGGQRQRVALARALAPKPSVLLLDEPFGALDAKVRLELRGWLRKLQRERNITCLFVTHDQEEAMELADRVVIIHRGRVEQIGTPEEVYEAPKTAFTASFVGSANMVSARIVDGRIDVAGIPMAAEGREDGADVRAFVRHHKVEIVGKATKDSPSELARAIVRRAVKLGWLAKIELETANGATLFAELPKETLTNLDIREGDEVLVNLKSATMFVEDYVI